MVATLEQSYPLGAAVKLETDLGETVEGEVFAFDDSADLIALRAPCSKSSKAVTLRIIKASCVKKVLQSTSPHQPFYDKLPAIDERRQHAKLQKATQVAQEKVERQGLGVSKEGQQIFDCIYKTLPCKWQEKTIIVLNEVHVKEPYDTSSVTKAHSDVPSTTLERVILMVKSERERLGLK
ncbi:hypothetical protein CVIRNUC_000681 [Coccomyxa viridis]|uniref:AD domain-containing protein n=1 Tax=Coccomyxa viridis TaxID=1274662 RepID=A0AAV1HV01_9CHLO|nr:hypothetical protein CVIRNUC_000681 [Coccomyxa viridis]